MAEEAPPKKRISLDNWAILRQKEVNKLAKTEDGKKVVPVKPYIRKFKGKTIRVKRHKRSTPN